MKIKIIPIIFLIIFSNILVAQSKIYIGKIEYIIETLLPSGVYKETKKSCTHFNNKGYSFEHTRPPKVDIDYLVANRIKASIQIKQKYNIPIDSFEIAKDKIKFRREIEESLIQRDTINTHTFIDYNSLISKNPQSIEKNNYCVVDTFKKIEWILLADTATIDGLFCQKATTSHNGSIYDVWFAPSIPFGAGPMNIYGLPGLIISVTRGDKKLRYRMLSLEYPLKKPIKLTSCSNEKTISKKEFDQLLENKRKANKLKIEQSRQTYQ